MFKSPELRVVLATALTAVAACAAPRTAEAPAVSPARFLYNECVGRGISWQVLEDDEGLKIGPRQEDSACDGFGKEPAVVTPGATQRIEYLNGDGAWVVSKGNTMTVEKGGLRIRVSCVPGGVAFSTEASGLADSKSYRLAVIDPVLGVSGREEILAAGMGNQAIRTSFDREYGTITGTGDGKPKKILSGKPYTFSVYEDSKPTSVAQVNVITPDRC